MLYFQVGMSEGWQELLVQEEYSLRTCVQIRLLDGWFLNAHAITLQSVFLLLIPWLSASRDLEGRMT
jgi:hypothetical protein